MPGLMEYGHRVARVLVAQPFTAGMHSIIVGAAPMRGQMSSSFAASTCRTALAPH
jgi:hypothetical protein